MSNIILFEDFNNKPVRVRKTTIADEQIESIGQINNNTEPIEVFHGSPKQFSDFDYRHLGSSKPDVMSLLGLHLSPDRNLCESLFAGRDGYVYTCELRRGITLKIDEGALMRDIVKFGAVNELLGTLNAATLLKIPYYELGSPKNMATALIKAGMHRKFDPQALCCSYINTKLKPLGIETIEYLNNIEWARDKRYDFAVMEKQNITITNMERPAGWNS